MPSDGNELREISSALVESAPFGKKLEALFSVTSMSVGPCDAKNTNIIQIAMVIHFVFLPVTNAETVFTIYPLGKPNPLVAIILR